MMFGVVMANILLSGDNALVIAMASRNLPHKHQKTAMLWGSIGAIGLRIVLTFAAISLLQIPYLQLTGGLLLLWIAIKLAAEEEAEHEMITAKRSLWAAIKTIIAADLVMSLDNIIAIAGVSKGNVGILVIGLVISIPIIIWGSKLIHLLMDKWPLIIEIGAAFLGWTAGEMVIADKKLLPFLVQYTLIQWAVPMGFVFLVVIAGRLLLANKRREY